MRSGENNNQPPRARDLNSERGAGRPDLDSSQADFTTEPRGGTAGSARGGGVPGRRSQPRFSGIPAAGEPGGTATAPKAAGKALRSIATTGT